MAAPTPEDPDLVARIRSSDPAALETVVDSYLAQVLRAARGAGLGPQEAEDVTQDTFATFIEKAPNFEGRVTRANLAVRHPVQQDRRDTPGPSARPADG